MLGSHNSWKFLPVRRWWMRPLAFTARCQNLSIMQQYRAGVRLFDLRIKFLSDGTPVIAHGLIQYKYTTEQLHCDLHYLDSKQDVTIRVIHEVRKESEYTQHSISCFQHFCADILKCYKHIRFCSFRNLYNYQRDYPGTTEDEPTCEECYSSVCPPKIIDDWWPWLYARLHNNKALAKGTDKEYLMLDFIQ